MKKYKYMKNSLYKSMYQLLTINQIITISDLILLINKDYFIYKKKKITF